MSEDTHASVQNPAPEIPTSGVESGSPASLQTAAWFGLATALLAGLATWGILQATGPVFVIPEEFAHLPAPAPADKLLELDQAMTIANRSNATLALGLFGLLLGALLATAEAASRHRAGTAILKGLLAGVVAGLAGAVGGFAGSEAFTQTVQVTDWSPLAKTIAIQVGVLGLLGFGVGVGVGLPYAKGRLPIHGIVGAVLGGVLAGIIYPAVVGYLLPTVDTEMLVPGNRGGRLPWLLLTAGLIGLVATGLGKSRRTKAS
jgi:hypothetical protein